MTKVSNQHAVIIANQIKEVKQERDLLRKVLKRKQDDLKSVQKMRRWTKKEAQEQLHTIFTQMRAIPGRTRVVVGVGVVARIESDNPGILETLL